MLNDILARVEKPSRYLGTELNSVHKDPASVEVRMALAFPDLYDLGLGNLGIHILYACVNKLPWAWCERAYAPGVDLERELRSAGLPLFALESRDPLSVFDLLGFTLQSELTFTNILNILDLGGIPLRTADRGEEHPLTCAGGPAVFNPEPLAPFMDFFVIGDGEDAIVEIAGLLRAMKGRPRAEKLEALAKLEGVYVPALYPFVTHPDGRILPDPTAPKIRKRITRDLDGATFPVDYIVPFTQQVHDRISLEVLRGCTQGCRFCQAGMTTRPVRERSMENLDQLLKRTLETTGYEEVSLVSLSTCDYSRVRQLVENTVETARDQRVSVSLPSLRLDSFSVELADMVSETRRTGLTFAPEAASPRLRAVINKWIPDEGLLEMSHGAFSRGWGHVKLYFMIGLPTERDDDILAIADLARRTVAVGRKVQSKAKVNLGVSTFVPKPFTPFQWAAQIGLHETQRKQDVLQAAIGRDASIKFGRHDPEETWLEGLVSRADRRAADLIELAFRKGARFDAWREHLRFDLWQEAIAELGYDVEDALRERSVDEPLPWDHLDVLVAKSWFAWDWAQAMELKHAQDCRHSKCHQCGVIDTERPLCASMLRKSIQGRKPETAWARKPTPEHVEPEAVQRLWLRIARVGEARLLSHLEAMNAWMRALRRAGVPLSYSQGFHPHPRMAFSSAAPVGEESVGEYLDVVLHRRVVPEEVVERLGKSLPKGFAVLSGREVDLRSPSLMGLAAGATYTAWLPGIARDELARRVGILLGSETLEIERSGKQRGNKKGPYRQRVVRGVDVRPMIRALAVREPDTEGASIGGAGVAAVDLTLVTVDGKPGKVKEIVALLTDDPGSARILKRDTLALSGDALVSLSEWRGAARAAEGIADGETA